jgi:hypothetical protein
MVMLENVLGRYVDMFATITKMCFNTFNEISATTWVGLTTENNAEPPSVGSRYCGSSSLTDGFSINPPQ